VLTCPEDGGAVPPTTLASPAGRPTARGRGVGGADFARLGVVSIGDRVAQRPQVQDRSFPPFAPIPGRGLPQAQPGEIPTRRVRIMRACGAFATSLAAAATLSLGPAVVLAKLGSDAPVVVVFSATALRVVLPIASLPEDFLWRCELRRPRDDWGARGPLVIASAMGSPRGRTRDVGVTPPREAGPLDRATARLAARRLRWRPGSEASLPPARRPRPPPAAGAGTPPRFACSRPFAPATPSLLRWCAPAFLSPRV